VTLGFHQAAADINADHRLLVYAGAHEVPGKDGLRALPLPAAIAALRGISRSGP
jgi:hypothetical protein